MISFYYFFSNCKIQITNFDLELFLIGNGQRKCQISTRSRLKRSASEMEDDVPSPMDEATLKRSKLAAALQRPIYAITTASGSGGGMFPFSRVDTQQQPQQQMSWPYSNNSFTPMLPHQQHDHHQSMLGALLTAGQLPDLSKDLAVLPTMSDCSDRASTASSNWVSMPSSSDQNSTNGGFDSYDSGWNGTEDSYEIHNTWKVNSMNNSSNCSAKTHLQPNNVFDTTISSDISQSVMSGNSSSAYLEDDVFTTGVEPCRPEEFVTPVSIFSVVPSPLNSSSSSCSGGTYHELSAAPITTTSAISSFPIATQPPQFVSSLQPFHHSSMAAPLHDPLRFRSEFCYSLSLGYPHFFYPPHQKQMVPNFRVLPPGNPKPLTVNSGRNIPMTTVTIYWLFLFFLKTAVIIT